MSVSYQEESAKDIIEVMLEGGCIQKCRVSLSWFISLLNLISNYSIYDVGKRSLTKYSKRGGLGNCYLVDVNVKFQAASF